MMVNASRFPRISFGIPWSSSKLVSQVYSYCPDWGLYPLSQPGRRNCSAFEKTPYVVGSAITNISFLISLEKREELTSSR
jgi:hypothetical protein